MADKKISQLTAAAALTGTEVVPIVQSGDTVKATTQNIANLFSLGYTAENVANKSTTTSLGTSNTLYPTQNAVKVYADTVAAAAAAGKELLANKSINTALGTSDTLYPSQNAVKVYVDGSVSGLLDDRGSYTPSVSSPGAYPSTGGSGTAGAIMKGDLWFMSASGFLGTTAVAAGATVRALVNTPGQTDANWNILSAGSISITTPNLDQVTTAGATTSVQSISIINNLSTSTFTSFSTGGNGGAEIGYNTSSKGFLNVNNGTNTATVRANNLTASRQIQLPDADGTLALAGYKVYSALLTVSGGLSVTVLENTLGVVLNVTNPSNGIIRLQAASGNPFTVGKTYISSGAYYNGDAYFVYGEQKNPFPDQRIEYTFVKYNNTITGTPGLDNYSIEIRVYP